MPEPVERLQPLTCKYLLVIGIDQFSDSSGRRYLDPLWYKDLIEHFRYLKNLTVACPLARQDPPKGAVRIDNDPLFEGVRFVDLPRPRSLLRAILSLPASLRILWREIGDADVVHSAIAGWPIPQAWLTTPIALVNKAKSVIVVESAFWRVPKGSPFRARVREWLSEILNRYCVNCADLSIFTQPEYKKTLLTKDGSRGHIINASWIDDQYILSHDDAVRSWARKISSRSRLNVVYVGKLVEAKGVAVLLDAMKKLDHDGVPVHLDILGEGELLQDCQDEANAVTNSVRIRLLGTLPYGPELFVRLRDYHAVVAPILTDEQPRIVYDAFSQAVPVLASDTDGLRSCINDGVTGLLLKRNDSTALADRLSWSRQNPEQLETMGLKAVEVARRHTHRSMHEERWALLLEMFRTVRQ